MSERISETLCYQSIGTQSMVCKEDCEAFICNERLQTNQPLEGMKAVELKKGDCLFLDEELKLKFSEGKKEKSYVPAWDKLVRLLLVPYWAIGMHGDPCGEKWFHPVQLSSEQASMALKSFARPGVFLVYVPSPKNKREGQKFALSILSRERNGFVTRHLPVNKERSGNIEIQGKTFASIQEGVEYHKSNKGKLPCRLRFPPAETDRIITKGEHYDEKWHVPEEDIEWQVAFDSRIAPQRKVLQGYMDMLPVAIKYRSSDHRLNPWSYEDFFEEATILSKLDHRNIVQLRGFSFDSHRDPFIVMEFVEGGTLLEAIKKQKIDRSVENIAKMFKQILMALHYLESKNFIIHCNVSARNVLLGESQCLKLADFGHARMVPQNSFITEESKAPVRWSAPEVSTALFICLSNTIGCLASNLHLLLCYSTHGLTGPGYRNILIT